MLHSRLKNAGSDAPQQSLQQGLPDSVSTSVKYVKRKIRSRQEFILPGTGMESRVFAKNLPDRYVLNSAEIAEYQSCKNL